MRRRFSDRSVLFSGLVTCLAALGFAGCDRPAPPKSVAAKTQAKADAAPSPTARSTSQLVYHPSPLGAPASEFGRPLITHVLITDLDRDGLQDVLYCEGQKNTVRWIRQSPLGVFNDRIIARDILAPAHLALADLHGRGKSDVLVASMGQITPNNDRIGSVVVLENTGDGQFRKQVLLERTARVTDVRAANLSGHTDGKLDLVVGQFGYAQGETRWMKNLGNGRFESQAVNQLSGCVHTPVGDFDGDGTIDFSALISQEWEEVHLFRNDGRGNFSGTVVWGSTNEDFGSSGLTEVDLNRDGRLDLIYTNGDGFDYAGYGTRSWHGLQWLENLGEGKFRYHRVGDLPGAYSPCAADLNGDGHLDLITVSGFADWEDPASVSMMAWINDGQERFAPLILAHRPGQLVTAAVGDLDKDGVPEIVTGGFHAYPPFDHMSSVTLWKRRGAE